MKISVKKKNPLHQKNMQNNLPKKFQATLYHQVITENYFNPQRLYRQVPSLEQHGWCGQF